MSLTQQEKEILASIHVPSESNPDAPEFPPDNPRFPATPTVSIAVPGFSDVLLKDESVNLTGTHKDRMAWEMVVTYKQFLLSKHHGIIEKLPELSILSSGSAALAIQTQLTRHNLPHLRVLMDTQTDSAIVENLRQIGCRVYQSNLQEHTLNWKEILALTENLDGFDITSNEAFDPTLRFYDWMSYEIINSDADFVFIPFGTGQLYENILNIAKQELMHNKKDKRFLGSIEKLKQCSFIGATTDNPMSRADKLYAPFLPFANYSQQWIRYYVSTGIAGRESKVSVLDETCLNDALALAQENTISCEPSGIAGLAMMLQMKEGLPRDKKMLVVNTGMTKWSQVS